MAWNFGEVIGHALLQEQAMRQQREQAQAELDLRKQAMDNDYLLGKERLGIERSRYEGEEAFRAAQIDEMKRANPDVRLADYIPKEFQKNIPAHLLGALMPMKQADAYYDNIVKKYGIDANVAARMQADAQTAYWRMMQLGMKQDLDKNWRELEADKRLTGVIFGGGLVPPTLELPQPGAVGTPSWGMKQATSSLLDIFHQGFPSVGGDMLPGVVGKGVALGAALSNPPKAEYSGSLDTYLSHVDKVTSEVVKMRQSNLPMTGLALSTLRQYQSDLSQALQKGLGVKTKAAQDRLTTVNSLLRESDDATRQLIETTFQRSLAGQAGRLTAMEASKR